MIVKFSEWAKVKEQQIEEGKFQLMQHDLMANPKPGDLIVNANPEQFVDEILANPNQKRMPGEEGLKIGIITSISHGMAQVSPIGGTETYQMDVSKSHYFRDVTDAFDASLSDIKGSVLLNVGSEGDKPSEDDRPTLDDKLRKWKASTVVGSGDLEQLAVRNAIGGKKLVKKGLLQSADKKKLAYYKDIILRAKSGEDITNAFRDEGDVDQWTIRDFRKAAEAIGQNPDVVFQQFRAKGIPIPGEAPLSKSQQTSMAAVPTDDFFGKIQQQSQADKNAKDAKAIRMDPEKAAAIGQARNPSPIDSLFRKAEWLSRPSRWKMFQEHKVYQKYPTS